jgi:hypothetical protein
MKFTDHRSWDQGIISTCTSLILPYIATVEVGGLTAVHRCHKGWPQEA